MKTLVLILTFITVSVSASAPSNWSRGGADYYRYIKKTTPKYILLYFHTSWCPACKSLNRRLNNRRVKNLLKDFITISVKLDRGDSKSNKNLSREFGVTSYPRIYVVDTNNFHKRLLFVGAPGNTFRTLKRKLRNELRNIRNGRNRNNKKPYKVIIIKKENKNDKIKNSIAMANFYINNAKYKEAITYYKKLEVLDSSNIIAKLGLGLCNQRLSKRENGLEKRELLLKAKGYYQEAMKLSNSKKGKREFDIISKELEVLKNL